ncbi:hypothetical protein [Burkholderia sp. BE12]|uniref:hypothetical protein n=1 Tax=Burkholderia sp. BE12 TaxID=2082394 RepID=UPI000CF42CB3|nr:hypothetical protein [Burkholderia sp. BE12]
MHPKAATLALAGLLPYQLKGQTTVRLARPGFKEGDGGLRCGASRSWAFGEALEPEAYDQVGWDCLPDAIWDYLPDEMLQRAIEGA